MAVNINPFNKYKKDAYATQIDEMMDMARERRVKFERRWYENYFFDDGFHFRYMSRSTGKIVDLSEKSVGNTPIRAIPKASRQIRGVANLLLAPDYVPVVYPRRVNVANYADPQIANLVKQAAIDEAKKVGYWIQEEFKSHDIRTKLTLMLILASKSSVSFMEIWPDAVDEKIRTQVFDSFDVYVLGDVTDIQDSPFLIKSMPQTLDRIKSNELFDKDKRESLTPDNKFASSELKDAYNRARYGTGSEQDRAVTVLLKEAFVKEYLSEDTIGEIGKEFPKAVKDKKVGDVILRHTFSAGGVTLRDEYLSITKYPFVAFTFEPGPLYQTSLIERFVPMNKSLDIAVSRVERYVNTMASGHWVVREGEDFKITNIPGGAKYTYKTTPPVQGSMSPMPNTVNMYIDLLQSLIEEQGASVSSLNQLPTGVKSGVAIENLKETEFLNLKIASDQLKRLVNDIAEVFIDIAANTFVNIQGVERMENGSPDYFDIIGEVGIDLSEETEEEAPDAIVIRRDQRVDIEVEPGAGFTRAGQKDTAQQFANYILELAKVGAVPPEVVKLTVRKMIEMFGFGMTQEISEALEQPTQQGAVAEEDTQAEDEKQINIVKVGVAESLKDLGLIPGGQQNVQQRQQVQQ